MCKLIKLPKDLAIESELWLLKKSAVNNGKTAAQPHNFLKIDPL